MMHGKPHLPDACLCAPRSLTPQAKSILWSIMALCLAMITYSTIVALPFSPAFAAGTATLSVVANTPSSLFNPSGSSDSLFAMIGTGVGGITSSITLTMGADPGKTDINTRQLYALYYMDVPQPSESVDDMILVSVVGLVIIVVLVYLLFRYRAQCEQLFRRFLVLDIGMIYVIGGATLGLVVAAVFQAKIDWLTFALLFVNFGVCGTWSLYCICPESIHHLFLVALNIIMAVMMTTVLNAFIVLLLLVVLAMTDVISDLRPQWGMIAGFVLPVETELLYRTPRILYAVGRIKLRSVDFMWYALLLGSLRSEVVPLATALACIFFGLTSACFIAPFFGLRHRRPLPFVLVLTLFCVGFAEFATSPFVTDISRRSLVVTNQFQI